MGKRKLVALLKLSYWCLVIAVWLFVVCLQFVIVVFPDHTNLFLFQDNAYWRLIVSFAQLN